MSSGKLYVAVPSQQSYKAHYYNIYSRYVVKLDTARYFKKSTKMLKIRNYCSRREIMRNNEFSYFKFIRINDLLPINFY